MSSCLAVVWRIIYSGVSSSHPYICSYYSIKRSMLQHYYAQYISYNIIMYIETGGSHFQPLSWILRMKIALGAAKGLAFLHSAEPKVIYRDFKASNILLDSVCNLARSFNDISVTYLNSFWSMVRWNLFAAPLTFFLCVGRTTMQNSLISV